MGQNWIVSFQTWERAVREQIGIPEYASRNRWSKCKGTFQPRKEGVAHYDTR